MVKALLLIAFTANAFFCAASSGRRLKCKYKNEVYDPCPSGCPPRTCGIDDANESCERGLPEGHPDCPPPECKCKDGFYRNDVGECVCWDVCPVCRKPNEIYDPCPAKCPPRECGVNEALVLCAVPPKLGDPECEPGCRCRDGYVKNQTDICIPKSQCPKCPNPNEVFDICIAPCPPRRCDVDKRWIKCAAPPKPGDPSCEAGCRCADGYLRDYKGVCIPEDECPKCTMPHEVFDPYPPSCPPLTCESIGRNKKHRCPKDNGQYDGRCVCEKGYYRNMIGECILKEDCLKCKGPREYFSCGPACDNVCGLMDKQNQTNCPIVNIVCNRQCYCESGYARDENNICIPIKDCKVPKCPANEFYSKCIQGNCRPQDCSEVGSSIPCPRIDPKYCKQGCLCKEGYVRDDDGVCIPQDECGPICLAENNEVYSECINGGCQPKNCSQYNKPVRCAKIPYKDCIEGCLCKEGYLRAKNGKCIPADDCPEACNKPYEEYNECSWDCPPQTCERLDKACPIKKDENCKPMCRCKSGYYRNKLGNCITEEQCRKCMGPHEYFSCGGACDNVCKTLHKQSQDNCPIINIKCNEMCYCEKNYARARNGTCIPISSCKEPQCRVNERYDSCPDNSCEPRNCTQLGFPIACPAVADNGWCPGKPGCVCAEGYLRDQNGRCILRNECPSCEGDPNKVAGCGVYCNQRCRDIGKETNFCILVCYDNACDCRKGYYLDENTGFCVLPEQCTPQCGANEYYSECTQGNCSPQKCSEIGFPVPCADVNPKYCNKGCLCKEGYVRNEKGVCIPSSECPSCGGDPNKTAGCGVYCNQRCRDVGNEPGACILPCFENECDCRDGFYLDENTGFCVPAKECTPQCPANEFYSNCIQGDCSPQNCTQVGFPKPCPRIDPKYCEEGCLCKEGFVRNKKGYCVRSTECPSCGGDPNAESSYCGGNCNKKCYDLQNPGRPRPCPRICLFNSCECKKGYYFDENTKKCVRPKNCTRQCGRNESYSECTQGNCSPQTCSQVGFPVPCPRIDPKYCKKGCLCKEGYVRNKKGTCIRSTDCPSCSGDSNAVSSPCGGNCLKKCYDLQNPDHPRPCPKICLINSCECRKGYYLDENTNKCELPEDCTPSCGKDEVYSSCVNGGCDKRNCTQLSQPRICIDPVKCYEGCICRKGYLRLKNGTCVPYDQCPTPKCGKNERFELCPGNVCQPNNCKEVGFPIDCPDSDECLGDPCCICNSGYVRNNKGICRPTSECPSCGGDPNAKPGCGYNCGKKCHKNQNPKFCPRIACKPDKCDCMDGFFFDDNIGKCVKKENCSPYCDPLNYEVYDTCVNGGCGWRNCSQVGDPVLCIDVYTCYDGCVCDEGYYRLVDGTCVPEDECPWRRTPKPTIKPTPMVNATTAIANFERGNLALCGEFLNLLQRSRPGENFMFSSISLLIAMAQLGLNAVGPAADQINRLLNVKNKEEIRTIFPILIKNYRAQQEVEFAVSVKLYGSINNPFSKKFIEESKAIFDSNQQSIDFSQNDLAADIINQYVEDNTNKRIKNLVNAGMFNADTRCVLVNALYFLGKWVHQFKKDSTKPRDFYINNDQSVLKDIMYQEGRFEYADSDDLDCQILKMPYKGGNFSFMVFLPNERDGLPNLVEKLRNPDNYYSAVNKMSVKTVRIYIPVMEVESTFDDLPDLLKELGVTAPFDPKSNSFRGILENEEPLYVSKGIQKTFIKVDETGTEAAAATAVVLQTRALVRPPSDIVIFNADHPFAFFLMFNNVVTFAGCFVQ